MSDGPNENVPTFSYAPRDLSMRSRWRGPLDDMHRVLVGLTICAFVYLIIECLTFDRRCDVGEITAFDFLFLISIPTALLSMLRARQFRYRNRRQTWRAEAGD